MGHSTYNLTQHEYKNWQIQLSHASSGEALWGFKNTNLTHNIHQTLETIKLQTTRICSEIILHSRCKLPSQEVSKMLFSRSRESIIRSDCFSECLVVNLFLSTCYSLLSEEYMPNWIFCSTCWLTSYIFLCILLCAETCTKRKDVK